MDPSTVYAPDRYGDSSSGDESAPVSLETLLDTQLRVAGKLQEIVLQDLRSKAYDPSALKDLVNATNSLVALGHKTEEALKKINTLQKFVGVVVEFLRARSDSLGEDLLAELQEVAQQMGEGKTYSKVSP